MKKKIKIRLAKGVLLISFLMLFIRLIYSSISAIYHNKNNIHQSNNSNKIETKKTHTYKNTIK